MVKSGSMLSQPLRRESGVESKVYGCHMLTKMLHTSVTVA